MKKINNKGVTTIELIITFSITLVLATSIFQAALTFSEKMVIENNKLQITNYKNKVTGTIQTDLIERGLNDVIIHTKTIENNVDTYVVDLNLNDGSTSTIEIRTNNKDIFEIKYKKTTAEPYELFELPNVGVYESDGNNQLTYESIEITNDNNIFKLKIKLDHPDLEDYYYINLVSPY